MTKSFSDAEHHIVDIFKEGESFKFQNDDYVVEIVDKPKCNKGEPKTDIYVGATYIDEYQEFKISFKKENAEFLENKTNSTRAEQLLGPNWSKIITKATKSLSDAFKERPLIYKTKFGRTNPGSITLGWKFELLNKNSGKLSGDMKLNRNQVIDVYSGTHLSDDKKNSTVNGQIIDNSGIANYILFEDSSMNLNIMQDVVDSLIPIDEYVSSNPSVYFACKALNYRTYKNKYDGNRPLAVYVNWFVRDGKLAYELIFDTPLEQGGDFAYNNLKKALDELNVTTTDELNYLNVEDPTIIHE